jgi:hypothetical protein
VILKNKAYFPVARIAGLSTQILPNTLGGKLLLAINSTNSFIANLIADNISSMNQKPTS